MLIPRMISILVLKGESENEPNEIISGVSQAQEYAKKKGAIVNPEHLQWDDEKKSFKTDIDNDNSDDEPIVTTIDFDIVLTIGDGDKAQAGVGIFAASLGLGVKGETKEYSEAVNRIKFQILAMLPRQK